MRLTIRVELDSGGVVLLEGDELTYRDTVHVVNMVVKALATAADAQDTARAAAIPRMAR